MDAYYPRGHLKMESLEAILDSYGLAAACAIMLVKAVGVPIPIPGDVILLATAARAAEGKVLLWLAFIGLLLALILGGTLQFLLARGPARELVLRHGHRVGITRSRLESLATRMRQGGPIAIGLAVLTPGLRTAVVPASGVMAIPVQSFLLGLALGSAIDLGLHFAIGYAGSNLLSLVVSPSPILLVVVLALVGLTVWIVIARRRRHSSAFAASAWSQATCPVCLALGAVRLSGVGG